MEAPKFCFDLAPVICATYSIDIPVWEVLITVVVTALVTAITIRWSIRAAGRETMRTLRASARAELRARRDRAVEIEAELSRSELRERSMLAATLMALVTQLSETILLAPKNRRRLETEASWKANRATFEVSPLPDAYRLYSLADLRIKKAKADRARTAENAVEFLVSHLFVEDIRQAAKEWAETGHLSERASDALNKLEVQDQADRAARIEVILQQVGALDIEVDDEDLEEGPR